MAKRLATTLQESKKATKAVKLQKNQNSEPAPEAKVKFAPLNFDEDLDKDWRRMVAAAVKDSLAEGSRSPIILEFQDLCTEDTIQYAYTPASQVVGVWLLETLEVLSWKQPSLHIILTSLIHDAAEEDDDETSGKEASEAVADLFSDCLDGIIKQRSDLGTFRVVLHHEEDTPEKQTALFVNRLQLHHALYHQVCQYESASNGKDDDDEDQSDDEEDSDSDCSDSS